MKALITGIGGFIGQAIATSLLFQGHEVVGYGRNLGKRLLHPDIRQRAHLIEGDVFDADRLLQSAQGCNIIFHCAALVGPGNYVQRPVETMEIETAGLRHAVLAALAVKGRLVYLSSSAVYGNVAEGVRVKEDDIVAPTSSYAVAKRYNELYLQAQHSENGLSTAILRIFNAYGPGQDKSMVVPRFLSLAQAGRPLPLFGGGHQTRDFVYIDDVAQAATLSAQAAQSFDILNVGTGIPTSIADLAALVNQACGQSAATEQPPTPSQRAPVEVSWSVGSADHMVERLGFRPQTPLAEGLRRCLAGPSPS